MSRAVKISLAAGTLALLLIVAAVAVGVSTLGGDDAGGAAEPRAQPQGAVGGGPPSGADPQALRAFRDCMAEQGLKLPETAPGGGPPPGVDPSDPEARAAFSACRDKLPLPGAGGGPPSF